MKRCTKCQVERPFDEFSKKRSRKDGLSPHCKPCQQTWRAENKAQRSEDKKAWRRANPEKVRAQALRYREAHREELNARATAARLADPERHLARLRQWRSTHTEDIKVYRRANRHHDRAYYARNREEIRRKKESMRRWCVYQITFPNGDYYIGSSGHPKLRFNAHRSLSRRGRNIAALNRVDIDQAVLTILHDCRNELEALDHETVTIENAMSDEKCLNSTLPTAPVALYWVYVIQSVAPRTDKRGRPKPGFFYVGMTTDPARRLRQHNGIKANGEPGLKGGGKYTAQHRPFVARALHGPYMTRSDALRAEYALKRQKRGEGRLRWSSEDSPWCCGEGVQHPWITDPTGWRPPKII